MNSSLGSNLSELDRLLLELNAVQDNSPCFPTEGSFTFCIYTPVFDVLTLNPPYVDHVHGISLLIAFHCAHLVWQCFDDLIFHKVQLMLIKRSVFGPK